MRVAAMAILLVARDGRRCAGRAPPTTTRPRRPRPRAEPAADAQPAAAARRPTPTAQRRPAPPKQFPKLRQASLLHKYQLGIAVMPGVGFRGIFPYAKDR